MCFSLVNLCQFDFQNQPETLQRSRKTPSSHHTQPEEPSLPQPSQQWVHLLDMSAISLNGDLGSNGSVGALDFWMLFLGFLKYVLFLLGEKKVTVFKSMSSATTGFRTDCQHPPLGNTWNYMSPGRDIYLKAVSFTLVRNQMILETLLHCWWECQIGAATREQYGGS